MTSRAVLIGCRLAGALRKQLATPIGFGYRFDHRSAFPAGLDIRFARRVETAPSVDPDAA
jgi:hypothetical protein